MSLQSRRSNGISLCSIACFSALHFFVGMLMYSFKAYANTIEKRYGFTSAMTGLIATFSDVGYVVFTIPAAVLAYRYSRPRLMAIGCICVTAGGLLFCMPHFVCGIYNRVPVQQEGYEGKLCKMGHETINYNETTKEYIDLNTNLENDKNEHHCYLVEVLFLIGALITGIGAAPILSLQFSYIDDHVSFARSSMYLGIVQASTVIGIVSSYFVAGIVTNIYVDIGRVDKEKILIKPGSKEWIGAWWIGILIAVFGSQIASLSLWRLKDNFTIVSKKENLMESIIREDNRQSCSYHSDVHSHSDHKGIAQDPVSGIKRITRNSAIISTLFAILFWHFQPIMNGTFVIKYLQIEFQLSVAKSSYIAGVMTCFPAILGIPLGGFILSRTTWNIKKLSTYSLILTMLASITLPIGCASDKLLGLRNTLFCSSHCNCPDIMELDPVCGSDGDTYVNACYAGCQSANYSDSHSLIFTDCTCLHFSPELQARSLARTGICPKRCESYLVATFVALHIYRAFILCMCHIPFGMLLMKSVQPCDKAMVIALREIFGKLIGDVVGTVFLGFAIDSSCSFSSTKYPSECQLYDLEAVKQRYFLMNLLPSVCGVLMLVLNSKLQGRRSQVDLSLEYGRSCSRVIEDSNLNKRDYQNSSS